MKALLLNSGIGHRMGQETLGKPKCMSNIGHGHTIISWQLTQLKRCGIRETIITTGPFETLLQDYIKGLSLGMNITYVHNADYAKTNYIYSMNLAGSCLHDEVLLLHGDLVLEPSAFDLLMAQKESVVAAGDASLPLPEKDFKARLKNGRVDAIGTALFGKDCVACQPAYHFRKQDFEGWMTEIEDFCRRGEKNVYAENALNVLLSSMALYPLEMDGKLCREIDNMQDLEEVSECFEAIIRREESCS